MKWSIDETACFFTLMCRKYYVDGCVEEMPIKQGGLCTSRCK